MISFKKSHALCMLIAIFCFSENIYAFQSERWIVPEKIRNAILDEFSGEESLRHVEMLTINRNRQAKEYLESFFETEYITEMAKQYGFSNINVDYFPSGQRWDAEEGNLWLVSPEKRKIAGLTMVPASLAGGSKSADVEAEVVYVGRGRPEDYAGKDVAGKIVLGNTSVGRLFSAVTERNAAGVLGTGSAGTNGNYPGYTLDQVGWQSIRGNVEKGFGFVLTKRQFDEMRDMLEGGEKVVVKAHVKAKMYPYKMNVITAEIPGTDPSAKELVFVAHAFETIRTPGGADNCSGVATILEAGRTILKLIERGEIPRPRRTLKFLWVPEISGTRAYLLKNPQLEDKILAAMNHDMTGEDLEKTDSWLRMKMTPDSHPHYLNELIRNLLMFVDQTDIRTVEGNNSPFNYRLVPYIPNSDHQIFLDAGIAAMQFNHWTDNFYHSSADKASTVDPTQSKRVGFMSAAAFYYLASAGSKEAVDLAWAGAASGESWMAEVTRQSSAMMNADKGELYEQYKAAQNKVKNAYLRGKGTIESVLDISQDEKVLNMVSDLTENLEKGFEAQSSYLEIVYRNLCREGGEKQKKITLTNQEKDLSKLIPEQILKKLSAEYRENSSKIMSFAGKGRELARLERMEVTNFINGKRSVLDIYNAVRAEYGNVTTASTPAKFAYNVTPETHDVEIDAVYDYILAMVKAGLIRFIK